MRLAPALVQTPRIQEAIVPYETIAFIGWDMAKPDHEVKCCGLNRRQAIDDAAIKLGVPGWRVCVRPALPPAESLISKHLA